MSKTPSKVRSLHEEYKEYRKTVLRVVGKGHTVTYKEWLEFQVIRLKKIENELKERFIIEKLSSVEGLYKLGEVLGREFRTRKEEITKERLQKGVNGLSKHCTCSIKP